jgi:beta-ketoacyl ACP synthase
LDLDPAEMAQIRSEVQTLGWRVISWGADFHDTYEYTIYRQDDSQELFVTIFLAESDSGVDYAIERVTEEGDLASRTPLREGSIPAINSAGFRNLVQLALDAQAKPSIARKGGVRMDLPTTTTSARLSDQRVPGPSHVPNRRRTRGVVVSGFAARTSLGFDAEDCWKKLLDQQSGIRILEDNFVERYGLRVKIGGPLLDPVENGATRLELRRMSRLQLLALQLTRSAWANCGRPEMDTQRLAVCIGTSFGDHDGWLNAWDELNEYGPAKVSPMTVVKTAASGAATYASLELGAQGSALGRTSGAEAIADAWRMIATDEADVVVAGGLDFGVDPIMISGFSALRVLSTTNDQPEAACRPFDKDRDGFVLSDGGALLVLESEEHARARSAPHYARLLGAAGTSDAFHAVAPNPTGESLARAMNLAMREAGLGRADLTHVTASASGTWADVAEAAAIRLAGLDHASVYAPKSAIGHTLAGAGAIQALVAVLTLRDGMIPATLNFRTPDVEIDLDIVAGDPRQFVGDFTLCNSTEFGGQNTALLFGH